MLDTAIAPDFPLTAIVETFSFGDAVQASNLHTLSTLFRIYAVHTEPLITGITILRPTAMQTVPPVADATKRIHTINILPVLIYLTIKTVVLHAIIAGEFLSSIFII